MTPREWAAFGRGLDQGLYASVGVILVGANTFVAAACLYGFVVDLLDWRLALPFGALGQCNALCAARHVAAPALRALGEAWRSP